VTTAQELSPQPQKGRKSSACRLAPRQLKAQEKVVDAFKEVAGQGDEGCLVSCRRSGGQALITFRLLLVQNTPRHRKPRARDCSTQRAESVNPFEYPLTDSPKA
jgi:hypothetical protein